MGDLSEVKDTVRGCMWTAKGDGGERGEGESDAEGGVGERGEGRGGGRIAWRYERMKTFQTTVSGTGPRQSNSMLSTCSC